jgi:hypothetical protein
MPRFLMPLAVRMQTVVQSPDERRVGAAVVLLGTAEPGSDEIGLDWQVRWVFAQN